MEPTSSSERHPAVSTWEGLFGLLRTRFERLLSTSAPSRGEAGTAGRRIVFEAVSSCGLEAVVRPIRRLPVPATSVAPLTVEIGEGDDSELARFWSVPATADEDRPIRPRLVLGDGATFVGAVWPATGMLGLLDRLAGHAVVWLRKPDRIGLADAATLVRALAAWWMADATCGVVHAAAVAGRRGAALLTGAGGTGKSSTAAACFEAGMEFLGDDSVFCNAQTAEVFSLSTYASLFETDLERYYDGLHAGNGEVPGRDGKVAIDLTELAEERVVAKASLCAIVSLERADSSTTRMRRANGARVLASLAPSSVFNVPTPEQKTLSMTAALVRRIPTYELAMGTDRRDVANRLRRFLDGDGPT